jgi:hypothetical protein
MEPLFAVSQKETLDPQLESYIKRDAVQTARFVEDRYQYVKHGQRVACGGLVETLRYRFYPHYKDNRSKRKWHVKTKGSSKEQGKRVDSELLQYTRTGKVEKKAHKMTSALLDYWIKKRNHTLQAAQLPVEIEGGWNKMTQADVITRDEKTGDLYLWEVKTGFPVGGFVKQDFFRAPFSAVKCTKYNIWQLQLHYTREALEQKGLRFKEANVIQIYEKIEKKEKSKRELVIKVHPQESWLSDAPKVITTKKYNPVLLYSLLNTQNPLPILQT